VYLTLRSTLIDIEAKVGQEYEVIVKNLPVIRQGKWTCNLRIDGQVTEDFSDCAFHVQSLREAKPIQKTFKGFPALDSEGKRVLKAFKFDKIPISELAVQCPSSNICTQGPILAEGAPTEMTQKQLERYCTVRLEMVQQVRHGLRHHDRDMPSTRRPVLPAKPVPEGSKPAGYGILTR
jgi:hypothetical protein